MIFIKISSVEEFHYMNALYALRVKIKVSRIEKVVFRLLREGTLHHGRAKEPSNNVEK